MFFLCKMQILFILLIILILYLILTGGYSEKFITGPDHKYFFFDKLLGEIAGQECTDQGTVCKAGCCSSECGYVWEQSNIDCDSFVKRCDKCIKDPTSLDVCNDKFVKESCELYHKDGTKICTQHNPHSLHNCIELCSKNYCSGGEADVDVNDIINLNLRRKLEEENIL